jgi:hypothetical protein
MIVRQSSTNERPVLDVIEIGRTPPGSLNDRSPADAGEAGLDVEAPVHMVSAIPSTGNGGGGRQAVSPTRRSTAAAAHPEYTRCASASDSRVVSELEQHPDLRSARQARSSSRFEPWAELCLECPLIAPHRSCGRTPALARSCQDGHGDGRGQCNHAQAGGHDVERALDVPARGKWGISTRIGRPSTGRKWMRGWRRPSTGWYSSAG